MDQVLNKGDVDFNLTSWINDKLSAVSPVSLKYGKKCIYEVQEHKEKYVPRVVSIGFLHHGKSQLEDMQEHKVKYLQHFLHTFQVTVDQLLQYIHSQEALVCECYEDTTIHNLFERCKVKPSAVILLDGIFIIELFLRNHFPGMRDEGDILFSKSWVSNFVLHDLLQFENQLPLRFLRLLYDEFVSKQFSATGAIDSAPTFDELVFEYFKNVGSTEKSLLIPEVLYARHFVEFLSILNKPGENLPRVQPEDEKNLDLEGCPSAVALNVAGVKFFQGPNVWFDADRGELTMPQLNVNHFTATFLRNLMAFEQSGCRSKHTTRYVMLLSSLIESEADVKHLIYNGIIKNELGISSTWKVREIFNSLYQEFKADPDYFHFVDVDYNKLRAYKRSGLLYGLQSMNFNNQQILRRYYFNSPWTAINFLYLLVALYVALIQTVFTVLQYLRQ